MSSSRILYIATIGLRILQLENGNITTLAGGAFDPTSSYSRDGSIKVDSSGNIYIADWPNGQILRIGSNGLNTRIVGPNSDSRVKIALDASERLYITSSDHRIFRVDCPSSCGNHQVDAPNEQCDDGNTTTWDGCESNCTLTPQADLALTIKGDPQRISKGQSVTYSACISNAGPNPANNVQLLFNPVISGGTLSGKLISSVISIQPSQRQVPCRTAPNRADLSCTFPQLASGSSMVVTIKSMVVKGGSGGQISTNARAVSSTMDTNRNNNTLAQPIVTQVR